MAYSTISKPSLHFNTRTYNGNGGTQSITGVGFQPDMVWLKKRNGTANHHIVDAVRGVGYYLYPNLTNAQGGDGSSLITAFGADGWTMNDGADSNASGATGVGWSWKANGAGSANTDGSINSTVSVNTTAGFSIVKFTGTGANATVGHGLGVAPKVVLIKRTSTTGNWVLGHGSLGFTKFIEFTNGAEQTHSGRFNDTAPTSSVFSVGTTSEVNSSGATFIAYCFAEKKGYSKFGSYTGNGNADGTFVYTGFKPAFTILKRTDATGGWLLFDNKRDTFNVTGKVLFLADSGAESDLRTSHTPLDLLSNGMKMRSGNLTGTTSLNISGATYIYMAFAEEPLVANVGASIPATAR